MDCSEDNPVSVRESLGCSHYGRLLLPFISSHVDQMEIGTYYPEIGQTYGAGRETGRGREIVFHTANDDHHKGPKYALSRGELLLTTDKPEELADKLLKELQK